MLRVYTLPYTESERYLGVKTMAKIKWDLHIRKLVSNACRTMGWIRRNLISRDKEDRVILYRTLILPHLEYRAQTWNLEAMQGNWKLIMDIKKLQRQLTRLIDGFGSISYPVRLWE